MQLTRIPSRTTSLAKPVVKVSSALRCSVVDVLVETAEPGRGRRYVDAHAALPVVTVEHALHGLLHAQNRTDRIDGENTLHSLEAEILELGLPRYDRGVIHQHIDPAEAPINRVNALASFSLCWLIPRLADFQARYPDIDVRLSTTSRRLRYVGAAFDVGVRSGPENAAGLTSTTLMPDWRLPACSPALLQRHPVRTVADLRNHTLLHSTSTRTAWSDWLREADAPGLQGARHLDFDHVFLQLGAATEGLGVTLASLPLIEREIATGRLVCPISERASRGPDYTLVVNTERANDGAVVAFKKWIMASAAQNRIEPARSEPAQKVRRTAPRPPR